jgi:hypothetical protein
MVWNQMVSYRDGRAIVIGYRPEQPGLLQVLCQREVYEGQEDGFIPQVVPHASTHQYDDPAGGDDVVYTQLRQWMPLRVGAAGGWMVSVQPDVIWRSGYTALEIQYLNLAEYKPKGANARYVLIALDAQGVAYALPGSLVTPPSDLSVGHCPGPLSTDMALAAVRVYGAQTEIQDIKGARDIVDLRWPQKGGLDVKPMLDAIAAVAAEWELEVTMLLRRVVALERAVVAMDSALDIAISGHVTVNA